MVPHHDGLLFERSGQVLPSVNCLKVALAAAILGDNDRKGCVGGPGAARGWSNGPLRGYLTSVGPARRKDQSENRRPDKQSGGHGSPPPPAAPSGWPWPPLLP